MFFGGIPGARERIPRSESQALRVDWQCSERDENRSSWSKCL